MDRACQVETLAADPDEVGSQALQLEQDDTDDARSGWHLGVQQFFHGQTIGKVVLHRGHVIHAVGVVDEILVALVFARLFKAGYGEFSRLRKIQASADFQEGFQVPAGEEPLRSQQAIMDNLERSLRKASIDQSNRLERAVSFLATTGNTAPFIGLFGTVWGIMQSFRGIGLKGSANLAVVAPGISEALIATAAGLAAAIPAVVAFNYFTHKITALSAEMDIFTSDFLSTVERQFFKQHVVAKPHG